MRASRLLSILTTLQARGLTTAEALAEECGVSLRTIYRDIDALSSAGIPVLSERGAEGGYRLLDGYRTQLNGLSEKEAEALFLTGLSGPAADLGLHAVLAGPSLLGHLAERKGLISQESQGKGLSYNGAAIFAAAVIRGGDCGGRVQPSLPSNSC